MINLYFGIMVGFAVFWVVLLWFMICVRRTTKHRIAIINAIGMCSRNYIKNNPASTQEGVDKMWRTIEKISYDKHLLYLLTFRNPAKLYERK